MQLAADPEVVGAGQLMQLAADPEVVVRPGRQSHRTPSLAPSRSAPVVPAAPAYAASQPCHLHHATDLPTFGMVKE